MVKDVVTLKQYLLGSISEEETREIEISIASDNNLLRKFIIAENELIEDFLERTLSKKEVELFHKNYLITPKRKKQVIHIAQLKKYAFRDFSKKKVPSKLTLNNYFRYLIPAITFTVIAGIIMVWGIPYAKQKLLENEFAQINKQKINASDSDNNYSQLHIKINSRRSKSEIDTLSKEKLKERVLFNLELPSGTNSKAVFKIELIKELKVIFTQDQLPVYADSLGEELIFFLPGEKFEKGKYMIKATSDAGEDFPIRYSFFVE